MRDGPESTGQGRSTAQSLSSQRAALRVTRPSASMGAAACMSASEDREGEASQGSQV